MERICWDRAQARKSSTYSEESMPGVTQFTMLLILRLKRVTDKILPWGTPVSKVGKRSKICWGIFKKSKSQIFAFLTFQKQLVVKIFLFTFNFFLGMCSI